MATEPIALGDQDRAALERLGIRWHFVPQVALADIDDSASRAAWNQARLGDPVDEDHVELLRSELARGVEFPPIIVYRDDGDRLVTLSGNHRSRAYRLEGRATIPAYEASGLQGLRPEDERVLLLIYEANHGHGKTVEMADRLEQGRTLIERGMNVREAAAILGVPENRLRDHYEASRATRRLEEDLGVTTEEIPISAQRRLANIRSDRVAKAAAALVPLMDRKTAEVNDLVRAVNQERTEDAQLAVISDYKATLEQRPAPGARPSPQVPPEVRRLDTALGTIIRFDIEILRSGIPLELRNRLAARVQEASANLDAAGAIL